MKHSLFLIFFLFTFGISNAKFVSVTAAKKAGYNYLSQSILKSSEDLRLVYISGAEPTLFYIFNGPNCFVIVSADDCVLPVLGYSREQPFKTNDLSNSILDFFEGYNNQIRFIIKNNIEATPEITLSWSDLLKDKRKIAAKTTAVSPLLTTTWGQGTYYDAYCPYDASYGRNSFTGCVATAMAQVMKYWSWPTMGTGTHSYVTGHYGTPLTVNFGATTYYWSLMPNSLTGSNAYVANLMFNVGVSVDMDYRGGGIGSAAHVITALTPPGIYPNCVEYALKTYFNYSSSLHGEQRVFYTEPTWISMLKSELDASRPIIYAGHNSSAGHCFVLDGYDASNNFHINWGWDGGSNGYFGINALNPAGMSGFTSGQQAVLGVRPSTGGCSAPATPTAISPGTSSYPGPSVSTLTPTFNWTTVSGATNYNLSISVYPFGPSHIVYSTCVGSPPYTLPSGYLTSGNYYRWDVQASISCGSCVSGYSTDYYFNTIGGSASPNLIAMSGSLGYTGTLANYTYSIQNTGTANAGSFHVNFYACTSSTYSSPIFIGSDFVAAGLPAGSTYSSARSIDLCVAGLSAGTYYLGFYIDYANSIAESNESDNNTFYSTPRAHSCSSGLPDVLTVSTSMGFSGATANHTYTVQNMGTSSTSGCNIDFYACTSPVFSSPVFIGSDYVPGLAPGATYASSKSINLCTSGLSDGTYYFGVYVDYANSIAESNEANNNIFYSLAPFVLSCSSASLPNLLFGGGSGVGTSGGNIVTYSYNIENSGSGTAGSFYVRSYLCNTPSFTSPVWVNADLVSSLGPGATHSNSISIDLCSAGLPDGYYYCGFYIDYDATVTESNETDNNLLFTGWTMPVHCPIGSSLYNQGIDSLTPVLNVYPNPAEDFINIVFKEKMAKKLTVQLTNLIGSVVYCEDFAIDNASEKQILLKNLSSGIYFLTLHTNTSKQVFKINKL